MTITDIKEKINKSDYHLVDITGVGNLICRKTFDENKVFTIAVDSYIAKNFLYCPICGEKINKNKGI